MKRRSDLTSPRHRYRFDVSYDAEAFGQFSESIARYLGTARFLVWQTVVVIVWLAFNLLPPERYQFDPWNRGLVLLTLVLSLQASYAAPLILLAQNRQEARERVGRDAYREQAAQSRADMDFLAREIASLRMSVGELATRDYVRSELRSELRTMLAELDAAEEGRDGHTGRLSSPTNPDRRER